jgi:carboxyl-terminal processing protease
MAKKLLSTLFVVLFSITVINYSAVAKVKEEPKEANAYELLNLFGEVMTRVKASYVEEVTDKKLIENAINGMLVSLDPHSSFLDAKSFKFMSQQTSGKFGGLGVEVTMENSVVKVVSPIDDTPAFKAGIKAGDYFTHIDGEEVVGLSLNEAVDKMRGKVGSKIRLTVVREGEKPKDYVIVREEIKIQSVKSDIKAGDVIYIRISSFTEGTDDAIIKVVKNAQKKLGKKLKGAVIDVRNNPGGLLDQSVAISDLFLDKGEIVSTRSRVKEDTVRYSATKGDILSDLPIVVLINDGSASASEIVAGALQDHKRAIVIGEKSFGKGSVQTVMPLGEYGAMRITTARYYTPSGRSIQAKGIVPDIIVKKSKIEKVEKIFERSEADLKNALKNESKDKKKKKASNDNDDIYKDYQLGRAIDLVKALSIYK